RSDISVPWRAAIGGMELVPDSRNSRLAEVGSLVYGQTGTRSNDRQGQPRGGASHANPVAIDPAPRDVLHVVVEDKYIDRVHQLEVSQVGKEIRLHDGRNHAVAMDLRTSQIERTWPSETCGPPGRTITFSAASSVPGSTEPAWGNRSRYGCMRWHPGQKYLRARIFLAWSAATTSSREAA